jgi:hypothetical protein
MDEDGSDAECPVACVKDDIGPMWGTTRPAGTAADAADDDEEPSLDRVSSPLAASRVASAKDAPPLELLGFGAP